MSNNNKKQHAVLCFIKASDFVHTVVLALISALCFHTFPHASHLQPFRPTWGVPPSLPVTEPLLCAKNILDALSCLICNQDCQVGVTIYLTGEGTEALGS